MRRRRGSTVAAGLLLAAVAVLAAVALASPPAAAAATGAVGRPTVDVVGVPGLQWSDVSERGSPALWRLVVQGAAGSLSIRSAAAATCPGDGWVMLGAGNRAEALPGCREDTPRSAWPAIAARNRTVDFGAEPGALGTALRAAGQCASARGPDAWLALGPGAAADQRCPVRLLGVAGPAQADAAISSVGPPSAEHVVIVVGLAQLRPGAMHQMFAVAAGGPFRTGALVSQSTRQPPYVQVMDVAPTILQLRGVPAPDSMDGLPMRSAPRAAASLGPARTVRHLADLDRAAAADRSALPWFLGWLIGGQLLGYLAAGALWRRNHPRAGGVARFTAVSAIAAPGLSYLWQAVPWWGTSAPIATLVVGTLACACAAGAGAMLLGRSRRATLAPTLAAACTALVIAVDLARGSPWQLDAPFGYSPVVAGRFVGMGNVAYGLFATAALLAAAGLAATLGRRAASAVVVLVGVAAVVVDGAPQLGSDFGGVPSLVLGFAVLLVVLTGARVAWWRVLLVGIVALGAVAGFALLDYSRPAAEQTHLGRFVGQLLHGQAATVITRKATANWDLLTNNPVNATVPFFTAWLGWRVWQPKGRLAAAESEYPELRAGLLGVVTTSVVGFFLNDSGVAIPAMAFLVAIPFGVAMMAAAPPKGSVTRPAEERSQTPHVLP